MINTLLLVSIWTANAMCLTETDECNYLPCVTWIVADNEFQLTCRVQTLIRSVYIYDPFDKILTDPTETIRYNDTVDFVFVKKDLVQHSIEGTWTCRYGNYSAITSVSFQNGIVPTTDVRLCGEVRNLDKRTIFKMTCFSCSKSVGNTAEFLINNKTVDSLRFSKGKCFHKDGECKTELCNCSSDGTSFQWIYEEDNITTAKTFTCEMRFSDSLTESSFRKLAVAIFNGTDFINMDSHVVFTSRPSDRSRDNSQAQSSFIYIEVIAIIVSVAIVMIVAMLSVLVRRKIKQRTSSKSYSFRQQAEENQELKKEYLQNESESNEGLVDNCTPIISTVC